MHKLVIVSRIDGLYKISIVNLSLIGDILEALLGIDASGREDEGRRRRGAVAR